jgi:ElaB/YqjD/DUF883 family membrane-anchored ribosome-binding protein
MESINTSNVASREKLMEDSRLGVAEAEELLNATANQTGKRAAPARALIHENLQIVKESIVAAETAMIGRTRQAAKVGGEYVRDNAWNWR